jgi:AcrR family transcriptional regulator
MSSVDHGPRPAVRPDSAQRREHILDTALEAFLRYGYRKTSMEDVARAAKISRPGLYFLFSSKEDLFVAAVTRALEADIAAAQRILADAQRPLRDRLLDAFDRWTGRYLGPMTRDLPSVLDEHPEQLAALTAEYPKKFSTLVETALAQDRAVRANDTAQTLISAAVGIKHQVDTRDDYLARLNVAIDVLIHTNTPA